LDQEENNNYVEIVSMFQPAAELGM